MVEPLPWAKVKPLVQRLGLLRIRKLCKTVLKKEDGFKDEDMLDPGEVLVLILATALLSRMLISEEQQDLVLDEYGSEIKAFGNLFYENKEQKTLRVVMLNIVDKTFVRLSGHKSFIDLRNGSKVEKLEFAPIEFTVLDLAALLSRTARVASLDKNRTAQNAPKSAEK